MYAIVEIQGQQFKAEAGKKLFVHYLGDEKNEGDAVEFSKVLLVDADGAITVGVIVFKKKRRKGYRRLNGHRQYFTELVIKDVIA